MSTAHWQARRPPIRPTWPVRSSPAARPWAIVSAGLAPIPLTRALLAVGGLAGIGIAASPAPARGATPQHLAWTVLGAVTIVVWPAFAAVAAVFVALLGWLLAETRDGGVLGLAERLTSSIQTCWPFVIAVALRRTRRPRPGPAIRAVPCGASLHAVTDTVQAIANRSYPAWVRGLGERPPHCVIDRDLCPGAQPPHCASHRVGHANFVAAHKAVTRARHYWSAVSGGDCGMMRDVGTDDGQRGRRSLTRSVGCRPEPGAGGAPCGRVRRVTWDAACRLVTTAACWGPQLTSPSRRP